MMKLTYVLGFRMNFQNSQDADSLTPTCRGWFRLSAEARGLRTVRSEPGYRARLGHARLDALSVTTWPI